MKRFFCVIITAILATTIFSGSCLAASKYKKEAVKWYEQGQKAAASGDYQEALNGYSKAIMNEKNYVEAYDARGRIFIKLSQIEKAINDYDTAIGLDKKFAPAFNHRSEAYLQQGKYAEAAADCDAALAIDSKLYACYLRKGIAFDKAGNITAALSAYTAYLTNVREAGAEVEKVKQRVTELVESVNQ